MDDRSQIEQNIRSFIEAYNSGDIAGVLECYDDDVIKLRNGAPPERKPELSLRLADVFEQFITHLDVVNEEIVVDGEIAFARGRLKVSLNARTGDSSQVFERRFLEIWRKADGRWLVFRTMDNIA